MVQRSSFHFCFFQAPSIGVAKGRGDIGVFRRYKGGGGIAPFPLNDAYAVGGFYL